MQAGRHGLGQKNACCGPSGGSSWQTSEQVSPPFSPLERIVMRALYLVGYHGRGFLDISLRSSLCLTLLNAVMRWQVGIVSSSFPCLPAGSKGCQSKVKLGSDVAQGTGVLHFCIMLVGARMKMSVTHIYECVHICLSSDVLCCLSRPPGSRTHPQDREKDGHHESVSLPRATLLVRCHPCHECPQPYSRAAGQPGCYSC
ncbi:hypothetical protein LZ32DRAFT_308780 [Colletotrichum eremochloae]|nr:hypothetical protein LZ32DRAFT_308780 [Colletotrichum eremochloae]